MKVVFTRGPSTTIIVLFPGVHLYDTGAAQNIVVDVGLGLGRIGPPPEPGTCDVCNTYNYQRYDVQWCWHCVAMHACIAWAG